MALERDDHVSTELASTPAIGDLMPKPRKASSTSKSGRRRASFACLSCRSRKVRCDVMTANAPCSNCRWDGVECVVKKRRRHKYSDDTASWEFRRSQSSNGSSISPPPSLMDVPIAEFSPAMDDLGLSSVSRKENSHTVSHEKSFQNRQQLPRFLKPLPSTIGEQDVEYLHGKGALSLPTAQLQDALLKAYIEFVHPARPILDLEQLLAATHLNDGSHNQMSLLLYQAIMTASVGFVDPKVLQISGYPSRREARETFFSKVTLLYDLDCEPDVEVAIQALLLLVDWPEPLTDQHGLQESPNSWKDSWHWMGVVISLAYSIRLNDQSVNKMFNIGKQKLRKRIWWCCFMLDSITSLALQRPPRIMTEDLDMSMLEGSDLETLRDKHFTSDRNGKYPISIRSELVEIFLQKARLCVIVNRFLRLHQVPAVRGHDPLSFNALMVSLGLAEWAEKLPSTCQYPLIDDGKSYPSSSIALQKFILHMIYHIMLISLQRLFSRTKQHVLQQQQQQQQQGTRRCIRECVRRVAKMTASMHQNHQRVLFSSSGVATLLHRMTHVLDELMDGEDMESWDDSELGYQAYIQALIGLQDSRFESGSPIAFADSTTGHTSSTTSQMTGHTSTKPDHVGSQRQDCSFRQGDEGGEIDTGKAFGDGEFSLEDWLELSTKDIGLS